MSKSMICRCNVSKEAGKNCTFKTKTKRSFVFLALPLQSLYPLSFDCHVKDKEYEAEVFNLEYLFQTHIPVQYSKKNNAKIIFFTFLFRKHYMQVHVYFYLSMYMPNSSNDPYLRLIMQLLTFYEEKTAVKN